MCFWHSYLKLCLLQEVIGSYYYLDSKELDMTEQLTLHYTITQMVNNLPAVQETWVWSLGQEDPLEKGMANHSSILAWRIPWTEEPGRLQSMGSQRVGYDWATTTLRLTSYYSSQCLIEVNIRCSSLGSTEVAILSFLTPLFYSLLTFFLLQSITSPINYPYASLFLSLFFWGNTI